MTELNSGDHYLTILHHLHTLFRPAFYLEIGVEKGISLSLALPGSHAIGVDPNPNIQHQLRAWTQVFRMTSEAFFLNYVGRAFDLIFIDGLHLYEVVAQDFINAEKFCKPTSIMLFHDTLPYKAEIATQVVSSPSWTGDVWKLVPALIKGRPDLTVFTIACPPTGLTVIAGFSDPKGLPEDVFKEFQNRDYAWLAADFKANLNLVENNVNAWLPLLNRTRSLIEI